MAERVVMAMSGGVDSSVGAYLLKKQGYDVIGVTMQIWQDEKKCDIEDKGGCCGLSAVEDARKVCADLDIPFYVFNFKEIFKDKVIKYFIDEYYVGRTPNPCIACNRHVKWEALLARALFMEAQYIATGHYAKITEIKSGRYALQMDFNNPKDQTYALYGLTQFQLKHTLMPLSGIEKDEVRSIAKEIGLKVFNKPDSQEICFISDNNYGGFIEGEGDREILPGNFINTEGDIIGRHKGIVHYTVGQRKGLGIAFGKPMFVKEINYLTNDIVLSGNDQLFAEGLIASDINYMAMESIEKPIEAYAKIRYSHKPVLSEITAHGENIACKFKEPQRAVTPGQAAVFYDRDGNILCGGVIEKAM